MKEGILAAIAILMFGLLVSSLAIETDLSSLVQTQAKANEISREVLKAVKEQQSSVTMGIPAGPQQDPLVPVDPRGSENVPPDMYF